MRNSCVVRVLGLTGMTVALSIAGPHSAVADAAMSKDRSAVSSLVKQKADANTPQADGTTALIWAVKADDAEMVDVLLAAGANVNAANREGATALYQAALTGDAVIIEKLLNAGADPNGPALSIGETALMEAARVGSVAGVKMLLSHGADVNAKEKLRETTALMWAAEQNHPDVILALVQKGADINAQSKLEKDRPSSAAGPGAGLAPVASGLRRGGLTPLVFAAREGATEAVRALVEGKADIDKTTADGSSAVLVAVQNGYYDLARYLIRNKANVNLPNQKGWTPLYLAIKNRNIETGQLPTPPNVYQAMDFIKLLLDQDAEVNGRLAYETEIGSSNHPIWLREEGATPFFRAAYAGDIEVMKLLLAHGADPAITTADHTTPLMALCGLGYTLSFVHHRSHAEDMQALELLLDLGADVNAVNKDGVTALMGAAHLGGNDQIQVLVDHGAKLDAHDNGKECPGGVKGCPGGATALTFAGGLPTTSQAPLEHPDTEALLRKLMAERGIPVSHPTPR